MNKSYLHVVAIWCWLALNACGSPQHESAPESQPDTTAETSVDTITQQCAVQDTVEKFSSEPGLFKMIQENYLDEMTDSVSILVLTVVSGCTCGLTSYEKLDSHLTVFRADKDYKAFWLLKGEDSNYSKKISKYHPGDQELEQPKRAFQEYGLFQNSSFLFEIHNRTKIADWVVIDN
ncbi:MAG: hypothetical protein HYZ14_05770 [Bacteroidetes bacterium]|nr:hypothetical protein [Bacteroidota bacterium]